MTGKQLSDDHRAILAKLLQIQKLNNHDIAWVLNIDDRTVRRRRDEFEATGQLRKHKDVSKNAEKLKPHHLEVRVPIRVPVLVACLLTMGSRTLQKLVEWHKDHPDALLDDMRLFLRTHCDLNVSVPTISRQMRKAYGGSFLSRGRWDRIRSRKQREAEGRSLALELERAAGGRPELYHDQRQLVPLPEMLAQQHEAPDLEERHHEQGVLYPVAGAQPYQAN